MPVGRHPSRAAPASFSRSRYLLWVKDQSQDQWKSVVRSSKRTSIRYFIRRKTQRLKRIRILSCRGRSNYLLRPLSFSIREAVLRYLAEILSPKPFVLSVQLFKLLRALSNSPLPNCLTRFVSPY